MTSCRLPFEIHFQETQRCQTFLRLNWYTSIKVRGLPLVLAELPARRDLVRTALFSPGGAENIIPNTKVQETRRLAQDELASMEQHFRLAMFHQNQGFRQAVQENQRRARDAIDQSVFDSPARCDTALAMDLLAAQLNNVSTMEKEGTRKPFPYRKRSSSSTQI